MVEIGHPFELLQNFREQKKVSNEETKQNEKSLHTTQERRHYFNEMIEECGESAASDLFELAKEAYESKYSIENSKLEGKI